MDDVDMPPVELLEHATQATTEYSPTPTPAERATSPPQTLESPEGVAGTASSVAAPIDKTPPPSPSGTVAARTNEFTPMRRGKVHPLDDSPGNRQSEAARWARAQADMEKRGKAVEELRAARMKAQAPPKSVAGGDAVHASGIPVWTGSTARLPNPSSSYGAPAVPGAGRKTAASGDPLERGRVLYAQIKAASDAKKRALANAPANGLKPLPMAPRLSTVAQGKQRAPPGRRSPPPTAGPSTYTSNAVLRSAQSEPWRPYTQYLPYQREEESSGDERNFPRLERRQPLPTSHPEPAGRTRARRESLARPASPLERKSDEAEARREAAAMEEYNEAVARNIQDQLWAEELAYNRSHRSQTRSGDGDPMEEDDTFDDGEEEDPPAPDSDDDGVAAEDYDSFDEMTDIESPDGAASDQALLNIEPAVGDDRAKAAARASIFAETQARVRWSKVTCEPIHGMTTAKLTVGVDPAQLSQYKDESGNIDGLFIAFVHAVGGTRSADLDRVTLVTALDTMIKLTCRKGTRVLFSAARQDPNGPRLRPGTVLIRTCDDELATLWRESAHWAQAGVRFTVQEYNQRHSAFMVTLEGTHRNRTSVAHGVRAAARKLPQLKTVFRQYDSLHPGKGRAARDNFIRSITARPLALTSKKALGFGTVQYNIFAQLKERNAENASHLFTANDETIGYPPMSAEMHSNIREAFQHITIVNGMLGDATRIREQWDCGNCFAESHPVGKCELKDIEDWFKTYEDFLAANAPAAQERGGPGRQDRGRKPKPTQQKASRGGAPSRGGPPRAGPSRGAASRRLGGN